MTESYLAWERKFLELSFPGAKVPGSESSLERKFQELSLPGAKVLRSESSIIQMPHGRPTGWLAAKPMAIGQYGRVLARRRAELMGKCWIIVLGLERGLELKLPLEEPFWPV